MAQGTKILAFAGSARKDSLNKKLLRVAVQGARDAGAEVTVVDLRDYPIPLYDGDLEESEGLPKNAQKLKALFLSHDALLIATPEYNSGYTPLLKNTLDWISRAVGDEPPLHAYKGKVAALVSASPGRFGGVRSLESLRTLLQNIEVEVIAESISVGRAHEIFQPDGQISDTDLEGKIRAVGKGLAKRLQAQPVHTAQ